MEALFDIKVIDTNAPSHLHRTQTLDHRGSREEEATVYKKALEDRRGTFTPFVTSVDGFLLREANFFLKHMTTSIAAKLIGCRNMCICQSSTCICPDSSVKLVSKRI